MPDIVDIIVTAPPQFVEVISFVGGSGSGSGSGLFEERVTGAAGLNYTIQSSGYTTANISQVFVDGILMIPEDDYVITNTTLITFTTSITGVNLQIFYGLAGVFIPGGVLIPPPPIAVFSLTGINILNSLSDLNYSDGGPSPDSSLFGLYGLGLSPASGNITITPNANFTTNFEIYNPNTAAYTSSAFTIAYTGGAKTLTGFKVRTKSGLATALYSGTLTVTAPNTTPFVLSVSGNVIGQFMLSVKTDNAGASANNQFTLPLNGVYSYSCAIDWGDGNITNQNTAVNPTHTYSFPGIYQIKISGIFPSIKFLGVGDCEKVISIDNWGPGAWLTFENAFNGCVNLVANYFDNPNTISCISFLQAFNGCRLFNGVVNFNTQNSLSFLGMFSGCWIFNQPINFDVSNANAVDAMLENCYLFNENINISNTSNVHSASYFLFNATSYNKPLTLSLPSCTNASFFLSGCSVLNSLINITNTGNVVNFTNFISNCTLFNQPISLNTSSCLNMSSFISNGTNFNSTITLSDFSNVTNASYFYRNCSANNKVITINTISVINFEGFYTGNTNFNQPVNFNTISATNMAVMFENCSAFNQPTTFNTQNLQNAAYMFLNAVSFRQSINAWSVGNLSNATFFMHGTSAWPTANLDAVYNSWSLQTLQSNLIISFGANKHTAAGSAGKAVLIGAPNNWTIIDGGI